MEKRRFGPFTDGKKYRDIIILDVRFDEAQQTQRHLVLENGKIDYICTRAQGKHAWSEPLNRHRNLAKCKLQSKLKRKRSDF